MINKGKMEEVEKKWERQQQIREEFLEAEFKRKKQQWEQSLKQKEEEWNEEMKMTERELQEKMKANFEAFYKINPIEIQNY